MKRGNYDSGILWLRTSELRRAHCAAELPWSWDLEESLGMAGMGTLPLSGPPGPDGEVQAAFFPLGSFEAWQKWRRFSGFLSD